MKAMTPATSLPDDRASQRLALAAMLGLLLAGALVSLAFWWTLHPGADHAGYSAPALFNQANAYAHQGKTGLAIAFYERARLLAPGDPAIAANLDWVRSQAGLPAPSEGWLDHILLVLTPNTGAWLGALGLLLTGSGLLAVRSFSQTRSLARLVVFTGTVLLALALLGGVSTWQTWNQAVIITPEATARISPVTTGEAAFKLRSGELITVTGHYHDFVLVRNLSGVSGWVDQTALIPLIPRQASL